MVELILRKNHLLVKRRKKMQKLINVLSILSFVGVAVIVGG